MSFFFFFFIIVIAILCDFGLAWLSLTMKEFCFFSAIYECGIIHVYFFWLWLSVNVAILTINGLEWPDNRLKCECMTDRLIFGIVLICLFGWIVKRSKNNIESSSVWVGCMRWHQLTKMHTKKCALFWSNQKNGKMRCNFCAICCDLIILSNMLNRLRI